MRITLPSSTLLLSLLSVSPTSSATVKPSPKRGLVYISDPDHPVDDSIWTTPTTDLTWYYNYQASPSPQLASAKNLQFVPMLWGLPASTSDNSFLTTVTNLINAGTNISHVLSFNEPDGTSATGGSGINPGDAAEAWIRVLEPLRDLGVKLAAPACTGSPAGITWLAAFFAQCDARGGCTADVLPIHWYGNFEGLASHLGEVRARWPNTTTWVTEYALHDVDLATTQTFFNTSAEYFDRLDYVTHYSYFGSFRSSKSNVGPMAAMLTQDGQLTDIGSWYFGGSATGNVPSWTVNGSPGKKSGAVRARGDGVMGVGMVVVAAAAVLAGGLMV